jgi:hypothetical protein
MVIDHAFDGLCEISIGMAQSLRASDLGAGLLVGLMGQFNRLLDRCIERLHVLFNLDPGLLAQWGLSLAIRVGHVAEVPADQFVPGVASQLAASLIDRDEAPVPGDLRDTHRGIVLRRAQTRLALAKLRRGGGHGTPTQSISVTPVDGAVMGSLRPRRCARSTSPWTGPAMRRPKPRARRSDSRPRPAPSASKEVELADGDAARASDWKSDSLGFELA